MWSSVQEDNGMDQQKEREVMVTNQPVREVVVNNEQAPKLEERELVVQEEQVRKLRYLGFVQEAVAHALVYLAGLYGVTKDHAGLLRPGVDVTESTVKGVVGPIYCKFHGVPLNILAFIDCKVYAHPVMTPYPLMLSCMRRGWRCGPRLL